MEASCVPNYVVRKPLPDVLSGRYRLERVLGMGGMGVVWQARDLLHDMAGEPDPLVAIKLLKDDLVEAPDSARLLYSEFAMTRHLHHPNVIRAYAFERDSESNRTFMTLEFMRGISLDRLLRERVERLPWDECRQIAVALLDALAHAHEKSILHGDVKPGNIMLTAKGLRLFDFGLGQPVKGELCGLPCLDRQRLQASTARYAAPEMDEGGPLTARADLYAVALLLYEMFVGRKAFTELSAIQLRSERVGVVLEKPPALPSRCWPALRSALMLEASDKHGSPRRLLEVFQDAPKKRFWLWR
ncbi:protein kinase [Pseudomonas syringae]|uniref:serine/threonine-protein kinase n=1 Tax=Pseudomonas syringae TaxID=317 RepID=UPI001FA58004|nr:serine/threonine-protein kinase [Pseudomonas syringae]MCF5709540.1 protein kinase [Pseudomonas syringae]